MDGWLMLIVLLASFNVCYAQHRGTVNPLELRATKGEFFIHTLHSGNFFPVTVDVKWSASLHGRPALPLWLHLMPSRHKALGYLYGTVVSPLNQVVIHVIARRLDNYDRAEQYLTIFSNDDEKYSNATQQFVEIYIKNYDPEDLLTDRTRIIDRLEKSMRESFRGKGLNPYIFQILPAGNSPQNTQFDLHHKVGSIVRIGTQSRFHVNVLNLERGLQRNPQYCSRNQLVPLNKFFTPIFQIDWCNFHVKNVTAPNIQSSKEELHQKPIKVIRPDVETVRTPYNQYQLPTSSMLTMETPVLHTRYYFWESFLMFPMLGVCCILLLILLSLIFFGRREGQHWRDYKTPKRQLEEYASVRDSQRHLRELSMQRQMLLMASDRAQSHVPLGIHTFLQPKSTSRNPSPENLRADPSSRGSRSPLLKDSRPHFSTSPDNTFDSHVVPMSKQTVAEAARACGSSLHLYRNPFESDPSDNNVEEQFVSDNGQDDLNNTKPVNTS
uniref:Dystroglycan-type cadherin-like domain-containing protein n=1 Tax=Setaria digitata TaxID=48799 RepID=A0A915Q602_9BILA